MKNKIVYLLAVAGLFFMSSCEDAVYKNPQAQSTYISFFNDEANLESALIGAYDPLGWEATYARVLRFTFDAMGGDSEIAGDGPEDRGPGQYLMLYRKNLAQNSISNDLWRAHYQGIASCNTLIEQVEPRLLEGKYDDEENVKRIIAEARFLKAFYYFDLTRVFGPVVLLKETPTPESLVSLSNREEGDDAKGSKMIAAQWEHIEELLVKAIPDLFPKSKLIGEMAGHASKESGYGLLTKKYVFNQEWDKAKDAVDNALSFFDINKWKNIKYHEVFLTDGSGENGYQSLFEVQFSNVGSGYDTQDEGAIGNRDQSARQVLYNGAPTLTGNWGINGPVDEYVKLFDPEDPRIDLIGKPGDSIVYNDGWYPIYFGDPVFHITGYVNRKPELLRTDYDKEPSNSEKNWQLIRFADVLLWKAEISAQLGDLSTALEYVNHVRERARLSKRVPSGTGSTNVKEGYKYVTGHTVPADYTASDFSDKDAALELIYKERRLELGMEGHTFHDLIRTGRADEVLSQRGPVDSHGRPFTWSVESMLLPIPLEQIQLHQGNLKQNDGYY